MKKIFGLLLICAALLSCEKNATIEEEPSLTGQVAIREALVNTGWVLKHTALVYSPDLVDNADAEPCKQDDVYKFNLSGSSDVEFGANNCSASFPPPPSGSYGSWELQADGAVLKQVVTRDVPGFINGEIIYWTVDYITEEKLRIKRVVSEPGKTYTQIDTYIRN